MRQLALALFFATGLAVTLALPWRPAPLRGQAEVAAFATLLRTDLEAPAEREHALATLRALAPGALARFLEEAVAADPDGPARTVALECLAGRATHREVATLVRLATPGLAPAPEALRDAFRVTLVTTLAGDARAYAELVPAWRRAHSELRPELLAAVAERGDAAGLELLAWVATFEGDEHDRALADACERVAPAAPTHEQREQLETLCALLDSPDTVCVQTISVALARARVETALPAWIRLLAAESRGTRLRARQSLEELSGIELGSDPDRWRNWYEAESIWLETRGPAVLAQLVSADVTEVLAALREVAERRLQRDELALWVAPLLEHEAPNVRQAAIVVLEQLGSPEALPALAAALADEEPRVARAAWSALRTLTGKDLPPDEELWRLELGSG
ncbi:MAG TPA: HEAT repeat domain-containing protein [Planctomycetota bacterium]